MTAKQKTPKQLLDEAVVQVTEDGPFKDTWGAECPITDGSCGNRRAGGDSSWSTAGWPSKKIARDRLDEHIADHKGEPTSSLEDFRAKHNLTQSEDGQRAVVITAKDF